MLLLLKCASNGESIPHQLGFKGVFILGGKTYIHINRQERSLVAGAGAKPSAGLNRGLRCFFKE